MSRRWAGRPCSPGSPSRQQRRADPGKRLQGARSPGDHRVDQSSEVVSRYLSLAWASGAASRRLSCVVSALGYEAVGITHSLLPRRCRQPLVAKTWRTQTCVQDRIKALKALRATRSDSAASSHAIHYKKKRIQSHYLMLPSGP